MAYGTRAEMQEEIRKRKQAVREKSERIRLANTQLVVAPKKTQQSLGVIQIDPAGVLHFRDGRWMKTYLVTGGIEHLPTLMERIDARVTFTHRIGKEADIYYLSLFHKGDVYEMVREAFAKDEAVLEEKIRLLPLSLEEMVNDIRQMTGVFNEPFDYQEFMKKRKDLLMELMPPMKEYFGSAIMRDMIGISYRIMLYPGCPFERLADCLRENMESAVVSVSLFRISDEEIQAYTDYMSSRYKNVTENEKRMPYMLGHIRILTFCKREDFQKQIDVNEEAFKRTGYTVSPCYGEEEKSIRSILTLGMKKQGRYGNLLTVMMENIFRKEYGHDTDKV